jgi:hypothetical protein
VIAPAKTGSAKSNKNTVINTDHTNKYTPSIEKEEVFIFKMVVIKLIAPKIEDTPAKCNLKTAKSTEFPE